MDEPQNPYASPITESMDPDRVDTGAAVVPAGQGLRFLNLIIDYFAQAVVGFMIGITVAILGGEKGGAALNEIPSIVLNIAIFFAYYFVFEATTSRTLGKFLTGTKVVNQDGGTPTTGQIAGRTLCRLIPFEAFSFFGTPTRGWHDSIPKTFVVKAR